MKIRFLVIYLLLFSLLGAAVCYYVAGESGNAQVASYTTQINRLIIRLGENWDNICQDKEKRIANSEVFEYAVIDCNGELLNYTKEGISQTIASATTHYDIIRDIEKDGNVVGKLIVHNPYMEMQREKNQEVAAVMAGMLVLLLGMSLGYFIFLKIRIVDPFYDLKGFAARVAGGNLETPLEMDKGHVFGAFTEAFDIMREELSASRQREAEAVKSRKELVAELSHDIRTPVASIKAMADVMSLTAKDDMEQDTIAAINGKADQIDRLVSNLFHATLEELEELEVRSGEISSKEIIEMVKEADYMRKVNHLDIKEGVLWADRLRLNQVISNLIVNSYKYADTEIRVDSRFEEETGMLMEKPKNKEKTAERIKKDGGSRFLVVEISDQGGGVPEAELDTVTEKFKRGSNAWGKDGSGLGLYLSRYFMEKMEGGLTCGNRDGGFVVTIRIRLV